MGDYREIDDPDITGELPAGVTQKRVRVWITRGVLSADRRARVTLAGRRIGGKWYTRADDVREFLSRTAAAVA